MMHYLAAMNSAGPALSKVLGTPPAAKRPNISSPPPAQPHIEPPPYDAAMDPAWQGLLDPNDHEFRNVLNNMSPEERQVLLLRAQKLMAPNGVAAGVASNIPAQ